MVGAVWNLAGEPYWERPVHSKKCPIAVESRGTIFNGIPLRRSMEPLAMTGCSANAWD